MQGLDRAMVIASQAFTTLIPLLILVSTLLPVGNGSALADGMIRRFNLSGSAADSVRQVFAHPESQGSIGALSVLLLIFSGVSLTRRLQRMYIQVWQLPPQGGVRGSFGALLALLAMIAQIAMVSLLGTLVRALPFAWFLAVPLSALASLVLWTSIPWLLLDRRLEWRRLLPAGALAGVSAGLYGVATSIYMPPLMESYSARYGLFGVTISLVGWLLCICLIVVASTVIAAELDRAPEKWARRLRARLGIVERETHGVAAPGDIE
jgi:membrane protein